MILKRADILCRIAWEIGHVNVDFETSRIARDEV